MTRFRKFLIFTLKAHGPKNYRISINFGPNLMKMMALSGFSGPMGKSLVPWWKHWSQVGNNGPKGGKQGPIWDQLVPRGPINKITVP